MKISRFSAATFGIAALTLFGVQGATRAADTDSCTAITSVPTTINKPGVYCVTKDLSTADTTGSAILITSGKYANNVTIGVTVSFSGGTDAGNNN
jgi:hypothetical protein